MKIRNFLLSILSSILLLSTCSQKKSGEKNIIKDLIKNASCYCNQDPILAQRISCMPKKLDNQAKLYWSYNCDSSWITFESRTGCKKIIFTLNKDLLELTNRIGHTEFKEFKSTFLYENKVISGCCDPEDYYLYDKNSGNLIKKLGRAIYITDNANTPFVISVTNSNYDDDSKSNYNSLSIYNLETRKEFKFPLKEGEVLKGMNINQYRFPEDVFEAQKQNDDLIIIKLFTGKFIQGKNIGHSLVKIDLKNYRS